MAHDKKNRTKRPVNGNNYCIRLACQPTSQQYCFLILNQHQPPVTNQSAVLFSHNKSSPAISYSQVNTVNIFAVCPEGAKHDKVGLFTVCTSQNTWQTICFSECPSWHTAKAMAG
jgi:hypothetical protein